MTPQHYIIYPSVQIESGVSIGEFSVLGKPTRILKHSGKIEHGESAKSQITTILARDTVVGSHVVIEEGVHIGRDCIIETGAVIEAQTIVGDNCFIVHGARLCADSSIGRGSVIGGFVSERSVIGDCSRIFGSLVHRQIDPSQPWDELSEPAPVLGANVFIGTGAIIIGPVNIGTHVYVVAGAVVTKDVPPFHIVHGTNRIVEATKWKGALGRSPFWRRNR